MKYVLYWKFDDGTMTQKSLQPESRAEVSAWAAGFAYGANRVWGNLVMQHIRPVYQKLPFQPIANKPARKRLK